MIASATDYRQVLTLMTIQSSSVLSHNFKSLHVLTMEGWKMTKKKLTDITEKKNTIMKINQSKNERQLLTGHVIDGQ